MTDRRDWHSDPITSKTVIDSGYRNTQNVRRFFTAEIGDHFRFDRSFMAWMKAHTGSTMGDAVAEWLRREGGR
ncbi:DUF6434 domain-containing protein [Hoeflea sp. G2-23]|uniref:DUF6434 domain-containing protein n=1 Tax=Hoeflea algicola TaxID=2983763 RepID=A0ABT3ZF52_9HYPH|nr:DUF6434 domain-containing protein [Hoeflea algicola]MCY0150432.1 DUF6434 domain-containing protein [Hoeflea algicola]